MIFNHSEKSVIYILILWRGVMCKHIMLAYLNDFIGCLRGVHKHTNICLSFDGFHTELHRTPPTPPMTDWKSVSLAAQLATILAIFLPQLVVPYTGPSLTLFATIAVFTLIGTKIIKSKETRSVMIHGKMVSVTTEPNIDIDKAINSKLFKDWVEKLDSGFKVNGILIQSLDMFGPKRAGFIKVKADIVDHKTGNFVPGICFLRGSSVAILVILKCSETNERFAVLVNQSRVPVGEYSCTELVAGMMDGKGNFAGVAAVELEQEIGLKFTENELQLLKSGVFLSPGGCDETMNFYVVEKTMPRSEIMELRGRQTGVQEEGESITVKIVPFNKLLDTTNDTKVFTALAFYEDYRNKGGLKRGQRRDVNWCVCEAGSESECECVHDVYDEVVSDMNCG